MNQRQGNIWVVFLAVAAIVVSGIVGFWWKQKQVTTPAQPLTWEECLKISGATVATSYPGTCYAPDGRQVIQPLSEKGKKNLQLPDETVYTEATRSANWKTYTNEKYGYEFKYPADFGTISETGLQTRLIKGMGYVFEVVKIPTTQSLDQWLKSEKNGGQFPESDWTVTNVTIAGEPALYLQSRYTMQVPGDMYAVKTDKAIYTLFVTKVDPEKTIVDQILSTFRFSK